MKKKSWPITFVVILVIASVVIGASVTGAAIRWRTRTQILQQSQVTYQGVLDMLNQCKGVEATHGGPSWDCNNECRLSNPRSTCIAAVSLHDTMRPDIYPKILFRDCSQKISSTHTHLACICCKP